MPDDAPFEAQCTTDRGGPYDKKSFVVGVQFGSAVALMKVLPVPQFEVALDASLEADLMGVAEARGWRCARATEVSLDIPDTHAQYILTRKINR